MVQKYDATNGLPNVKDNERRQQQRFSSFIQLQLFLSKQVHSSAFVLMLRSARKNFPRRDNFRDSNERKSREEYDEMLFPIS